MRTPIRLLLLVVTTRVVAEQPAAVGIANSDFEALRDPVPGVPARDMRVPVTPARPRSAEAIRRQAWARMIKRVFEVDPLLCLRCRVEMTVVAWITEPVVIDQILAHCRTHGLTSPFESAAPERAAGKSNGANPPCAPPAA